MRTLFWLCIITVTIWLYFNGCRTENNSDFQVKGKLANSKGETLIMIDVSSREEKIIDSAKVNKNGEFIFRKKVPSKGFYSIQISNTNFATIVADSSEKIIFEADADDLNNTYKVSGSTDSEIFLRYNIMMQAIQKKINKVIFAQDSIRRAFQLYLNTTSDSSAVNSLSQSLEPVYDSLTYIYYKLLEEKENAIRRYVEENYSSYAVMAAVADIDPEKDIALLVKIADALLAKYPQLENIKGLKLYVEKRSKIAIGTPAPEITMKDPEGNLLSLSSLRGKIVLIDFWASWCGPCRKENPIIVEIYKKFRSKGFEIFSVSLDYNKDAWIRAIRTDNLIWKNHVSDMKHWESSVVSLYGFDGIPFTVLLDRNGNVIAKNLRGRELEKKLNELLAANQ